MDAPGTSPPTRTSHSHPRKSQVPLEAYDQPAPRLHSKFIDIARQAHQRNSPIPPQNHKGVRTTRSDSNPAPEIGYKQECRCLYHSHFPVANQLRCTAQHVHEDAKEATQILPSSYTIRNGHQKLTHWCKCRPTRGARRMYIS